MQDLCQVCLSRLGGTVVKVKISINHNGAIPERTHANNKRMNWVKNNDQLTQKVTIQPTIQALNQTTNALII